MMVKRGQSYTYDVFNRRTQKMVNGETTDYVWDGDNLIYEVDGDNNKQQYRYAHGLIGTELNDIEYTYLKNAHGDIVQLTNDTGIVVEDYTYDAWGNQETEEHTITNPFRYSGEYFDEETGLIYLRNRYYDSGVGRFITEDPVKDRLNWYVYCGNNPIMFVDPLGLTLTLKGTGDEVQAIWQNIVKLSDDKLVLTQIEEDGMLTDSYSVMVGTALDDQKPVGTALIRRVIESPYKCTVVVTSGEDGANAISIEDASNPGEGSGGTIYFNPSDDFTSVLTEYVNKDGNVRTRFENIPTEIKLGHELIHVLRMMGGNFIPYSNGQTNSSGTYTYRKATRWWHFGGAGDVVKTTAPMEELATTGISYTRPDGSWANAAQWYTSENSLRDENGYGRRVRY